MPAKGPNPTTRTALRAQISAQLTDDIRMVRVINKTASENEARHQCARQKKDCSANTLPKQVAIMPMKIVSMIFSIARLFDAGSGPHRSQLPDLNRPLIAFSPPRR
jgi:hypothetical protein